jgi:hypothetical protein
MLFATTEEYMSKVLYGKSSYTGEYYADRIKITHGNDGPRGTLGDLLVIDNSSLYPMDELVINKDFEKDPDEYEETFIYFPITAPYSPLSDSPNARYGLAIKKQELEPQYTDEAKILKIALNELDNLTKEAWWPVDKNIVPRDTTSNGCSVYWKVLEDTAWIGDENTPSDYVPVQLAVINTSQYKGDELVPIVPTEGVVLSQGSKVADKTTSYVKITGFAATDETEKVIYGISDTPITSFGTGAQAKATMYDNCVELNEKFTYKIYGVPYNGDITEVGGEFPTDDVKLIDAAPDKYLILYSVKEEVVDDNETATISKFACVPLKTEGSPSNELLQYPCSINVYIESGQGKIMVNGKEESVLNTSIDYNGTFSLALKPYDDGITTYKIEKVTVTQNSETTEYSVFTAVSDNGSTYQGITLDNVTSDVTIKVQFKVK